jgi:hypothetical protein
MSSSAAPSPCLEGQDASDHSLPWFIPDLTPSVTRQQHPISDDSPHLFAFEELPAELRAVWAVANEAAQAEGFVIPQNMQVLESSVIRSLFEADGERDAPDRKDLFRWESKGRSWNSVRWRWRPARWPTE